jgi:TIGR03009 family protein
VPFFLRPEEQRELDEFLARWERYSATINQYDVNFNLLVFDPTLPGAEPNKPHKRAFGHFKYNANPRRFVYAVEGEWQGERQIKWDDRNNHIFAEKVIIDEKSVHQYDYKAKTVRQINVPPEMIGKGIADSPLPLIFGAKADDLKRRFSMRIVHVPGRDDEIWLHARPLLIEDQQEFKELEILLDKRTLAARGLKQWDINDKAYKVFDLRQPQVNPRIIGNILDYIKDTFTPDTPRGWKREEMNWIAAPQPAPPPVPAIQQPQMGNLPQHRNEMPLYRTQ